MARLGYLVSQYPKASHSFIRREIQELERRSHSIVRLAIRPPDPLEIVDPEDAAERRRTWYCLEEPRFKMVRSCGLMLATRPRAFVRALGVALAMGWRSGRGFVRHVAYFIEAVTLARKLESEAIRHIHVHFATNAATVARLVHLLSGVGFSMTVHGPDDFEAPVEVALREKIRSATFTVGVSDFTCAQLRRWAEPRDWSRIEVVRCTIPDRLLEEAKSIPSNSRTLVCLARLHAQKGQLILIDALSRLRGEGLDVELVLAGDGDMRATLESEIARLCLREQVSITGWIDGARVRDILLEGRAMVLPSFAEGLPVAIMEAFALERPVISTYVGGIAELVEPGRNGWLVPAGNAVALAAAMREVLSAPIEDLRRMGVAGKAKVASAHVASIAVTPLEELLVRATA